jgi:hypothetical protein
MNTTAGLLFVRVRFLASYSLVEKQSLVKLRNCDQHNGPWKCESMRQQNNYARAGGFYEARSSKKLRVQVWRRMVADVAGQLVRPDTIVAWSVILRVHVAEHLITKERESHGTEYRMQISDDHLRAIGAVAVEFGSLEWLLDNLLVFLLSENLASGEIVCSRIESLNKRIEIITDLIEHKPAISEDQKTEWRSLRREIADLQTERNKVLHASWLAEEDRPEVLIRLARKRGEAAKHLSALDLNEIAANTHRVNQRIVKVLVTVAMQSKAVKDT